MHLLQLLPQLVNFVAMFLHKCMVTNQLPIPCFDHLVLLTLIQDQWGAIRSKMGKVGDQWAARYGRQCRRSPMWHTWWRRRDMVSWLIWHWSPITRVAVLPR